MIEVKNTINDVFVWKIGNTELLPIVEEEWKNNIINAAAKCAREGEPIQATITSHLLQMIAGIINICLDSDLIQFRIIIISY